MYSLDINFLKDRVEPQLDKRTQFFPKTSLPGGTMTPLYLGLAVGLILPTLVGGGWLYLQNQNSQLEQENAALDAQLASLGIQSQNRQKLQEQINQTQSETRALATVFNQIRPWSAMLQDLRDRIPTRVQIQNIKQIAVAAPPPAQPAPATSPSPSASPPPAPPAPNPAGGLEIAGIASSFNDVNDFLLTLQQSPFLKADATRIVSAELTDNPIEFIGAQQSEDIKSQLPKVVRYTIQTSLSDIPASELTRELQRKGAFGLVTRIRALQQRGVIQP